MTPDDNGSSSGPAPGESGASGGAAGAEAGRKRRRGRRRGGRSKGQRPAGSQSEPRAEAGAEPGRVGAEGQSSPARPGEGRPGEDRSRRRGRRPGSQASEGAHRGKRTEAQPDETPAETREAGKGRTRPPRSRGRGRSRSEGRGEPREGGGGPRDEARTAQRTTGDAPASALEPAGEDGRPESRRSRSRRRKRRPDEAPSADRPAPNLRRGRAPARAPLEEEEEAPSLKPREEEAWPPREVEPFFLLPRTCDPEAIADDEPDYRWSDGEQVFNVVDVGLAQGSRVEEFDAAEECYAAGEAVVVETEKGLQLGVVTQPSRRAMRSSTPLQRIIRRVTQNDERQEQRNQEKARVAMAMCRQLVTAYRLPMKLISVEYLHGGNRAVFSFASEGRVDFRQLVRELATRLHTRIEMRQVGVRDAARLIGGLGPCGLRLCCNAFLSRFAPVSIRMAKDQNLVLNPQKVSGVCGRLMCCLTYEQKAYEASRKGLPKVGRRVALKDGAQGKVRDVDVLARTVKVQLEDGSTAVVTPDEIELPQPVQPARARAPERGREPRRPEGAVEPDPDGGAAPGRPPRP